MPATSRGFPYPNPGAVNAVPADLFDLATFLNTVPGVATVTTTERNALAGGALWDGRVVFNTTTNRLEVYDSTAGAWVPQIVLGDLTNRLQQLGFAELNNVTASTVSSSSTTPVDVHAALAVTFTVPASGVVYVTLDGVGSETGTAGRFWWSLREGATNLAGTERAMTGAASTAKPPYRQSVRIRVAGLTPGDVKTYKWAYRANVQPTSLEYGGPEFAGTSAYGPATMRVEG